ncbi:peptidoglycan recognition family protein [Winogradskyella sp.]|uniref:peptidoglycan recognition protein family protein n=1 Tax=Winogradskyella sp. TaxID=1883156 RepID=UPI002622D747|nr:peptidoglycan recognition family protein [Winogradskyella sp.]
MEKKFGFYKMNVSEFEDYFLDTKVARTVLTIQEHHTWRPSYSVFDGQNHFELQRNMRDYHVNHNGWSDIGQHISIFPDGEIVTGRSFERSPACIFGQNSNAFCIENIGNFDAGGDIMHPEQSDSIIRVTAILCKKFDLPINTKSIVYHHWFNLSTGKRNNGSGGNKSCPGTQFFGGNKVSDCEANFLPEVRNIYNNLVDISPNTPILKYVSVSSAKLNVRKGPHYTQPIARSPLSRGVVVRVFNISDNGWLKISSKEAHWISGKYNSEVKKVEVKSNNVVSRLGPGQEFQNSNTYLKGEELFVHELDGVWYRVNMTTDWIRSTDLSF